MQTDKMLHVFIDANVLLSFFEYTDDDLNTIINVIEGLKQRRITPYINAQLRDEVLRNREAKIGAALKKLKEQNLDLRFPAICEAFEEYGELRNLQKLYSAQHAELQKSLSAKIELRDLRADKVLNDYFGSVELSDISEDIFDRARRRVERGNPPKPSNSIGDAIHWEWLLEVVPDMEDLHLVSQDRDFSSAIDFKRIHPFLGSEWRDRRSANVYLYQNLTSFFRTTLPDIELPSDFEKRERIRALLDSASFVNTHAAIKALHRIDIILPEDAEAILRGCLSNYQIRSILLDDDVATYCRRLAMKFEGEIDQVLFEKILTECSPSEDQESIAHQTVDPFADI
ncbi:MAG: DUF4935 domain-containing protein [Armatimonadetes bacterium]|nr:DUF4935 domain-containing protein [Armatimonadota bacterium]